MKKQFITNVNGESKITSEALDYLNKNIIGIRFGSEGSFLEFVNEGVYLDFMEKFIIPYDCICSVRYLKNRKKFVTFVEKNEDEILLRSGIKSQDHISIIGSGIYCIEEEEYLEEGLGEKNFRNHFKFGNIDPDFGFVVLAFEYSGAYYRILHGDGNRGICMLSKQLLKEDSIIGIIEYFAKMNIRNEI